MAKRRSDSENPYDAPVADDRLKDEAYDDQDWEYGGFWLRFAAVFIDGLVLSVISFVLMFGFGIVMVAVLQGGGFDPNQPPNPLVMLMGVGFYILLFVVQWLYAALQESSEAQATLGKRAVGLRVTDLEGQRISFGRASGRFFAHIPTAFTFGIGLLMQPFTEKRQALHDIIAGTLVLRD